MRKKDMKFYGNHLESKNSIYVLYDKGFRMTYTVYTFCMIKVSELQILYTFCMIKLSELQIRER